MWRMRKLIKMLRNAKGKQGGSMITLMIPPKKAITEITKQLTGEFSKADCIKDRVTR
jgi:peptide subunit release factor 1 (eRF1)